MDWFTRVISVISFLSCLSYAVNFNDKSRDFLNNWCASVPNIEHATVQRYDFNPKIAHVVCEDGYQLIGEAKLICNNSIWNPVKLPYCEKSRKDLPPVASAGNNVVIQLPTNSVILNGSGSFDDNGIVSYHWWNTDPTLTVDMTGVRSSVLQLFHLQEGVYTFKLKVVDTIGQQSTDSVQVTVKPASYVDCRQPNIGHATFQWLDYGKTGLLTCDGSYYLNINYIVYHSLRLECKNGEWVSSNGYKNIPDCDFNGERQIFHFKQCSPPPSIENGLVDHIQGNHDTDYWYEDLIKYPVGTKVSYKCTDNTYQLLGNPVLECLEDMTWSRYQPLCIKRSSLEDKETYCPSIPPIPNGQCGCSPDKDITFCEPIYLSMKVQCSCDSGYRLVGSQVLICTDKGTWNDDQPTCVKIENVAIDSDGSARSESDSISPAHMNTLAVVIATACSVLGILLLIMVIMIVRRRKPRPRHFHQVGGPPPYTRVHSNSIDELDRVALIGYDAARLPTYEEAVRNNTSNSRGQGLSEVTVSNEFRPLPSIPNVVRNNNSQSNDVQSVNSNRHSITTMSTVNRDGISEVFGSIDTVNYSMSDASTSVTVDTLDSTASRPSHGSGTATAGSVHTSQENIVTEEAPLIVNDGSESEDQGENMDVKDEDKD